MGNLGFRVRRAVRRWRSRLGLLPAVDPLDLKRVNVAFVEDLKTQMPHDQAMELAIGGGFAEIGGIEVGLVRHYGLPADGYLVDVGCGSGRLARPLSAYLKGRYLGLDLVPDLVAHARKIAARPDWRFEVVEHIGIPEKDAVADMVCFFSVLTHLRHEQSYWYLEEARRVLKPGGRVVFSFLEFREPTHMKIFLDTVALTRQQALLPLNVFLDREGIGLWAEQLGMDVVEIRGGGDVIAAEGSLGQAVCVLQKRA